VSKTKYVEHNQRGFYVYDVALGVFLKHLIDAAEASGQPTEWLSSAVSDWRISACIQDIGLTFDERWSAIQLLRVASLAEEACRTLGGKASITAEEIGRWRVLDNEHIFTRGATEVGTAAVIELGRAVIALLTGALPEAPEGTAWLYGTENGRETLTLDARYPSPRE
jgi:hypothetical protein